MGAKLVTHYTVGSTRDVDAMDPPVPEATRQPRLSKIVAGEWYLDPEPDSSLTEIRRITKGLPVEALSVFNRQGEILFAPLVGEPDGVFIDRCIRDLRDRIVTHNHPRCTMLSHHDLLSAIDADMARIEAVCADGTIMAWDRPDAGWPDREKALQAVRTAFRRAAAKAKTGRSAREEIRKQFDRTLGDARVFGQKALKVSISTTG